MNFLAHLLLAGPDSEARLGAMLGDFAKPSEESLFGDAVAREMRLHRAADVFTDAHPVVLGAKALFRPQTRRFAGIVLDVYYDHALSRHWSRFCAQPREQFIADAYADLSAHGHRPLPERFRRILPWMIAQDWLGSYATFDGVEVAIDRISTRLSKGAEAMRDGVEDARRHRDALDAGFLDFFPQLVDHLRSRRAAE